jgi:diphthine-ammonia ligase
VEDMRESGENAPKTTRQEVAKQMTADRYAVCFSGGKDSALALDRAVRAGLRVARLVTLYDEASERVRFHAVPVAVMRAQAEALALPMSLYPTTPATFEEVLLAALDALRAEGIGGVIFGNIHLADVRAWYEERVRAAGLEHVEPLWGQAPGRLVREALSRGYTAILTCIEEAKADPAWLGQTLSEELVAAFERRGIDPCGERGEYHTLVTDGPLFHAPLTVRCGAVRVDGDPHILGRFHQIDVQLNAGTSV